MEFGKQQNIDDVDWTLPEEDSHTQPFLARQAGGTAFDLKLGTPAWGHREWVGQIYPPGTKPAQYLFHYSRNFGCIEFNSTHYRIPDETQVRRWTEQTPPGFLFLPKVHQSISHGPGGLTDLPLLRAWLASLPAYSDRLGPCFLQLPPAFDYSRKAELFRFLQNWPDEFPLAIEFRHPSWFLAGRVLPALVEYLQGRGIGLVITDVAGRRDVLHMSISAPFCMLRFVGNDLHPSDFKRSKEWARRIAQWKDQGLRQFFFMIHEPDDRRAPEMAEHAVHDLNTIADSNLPRIQWVSFRDQGLEGDSESSD